MIPNKSVTSEMLCKCGEMMQEATQELQGDCTLQMLNLLIEQ